MVPSTARPELDPALVDFARKVRVALRVEKIILFGSRARGDHLKESDYDLLVVSDDFRNIPFIQRMTMMYEYWDSSFSVEVFCYTKEEFQRKSQQITMVRQAVAEGIELGENSYDSCL